MIQSTLICTMHKKKISSFCLNQNCKQNRLVCLDCLKKDEHIQHSNDLEEFQNLELKIDQTKQKYNNLIQQLNQMMDDVLNLFFQIKKGIDDKYNLPIQRINVLTYEELIQYIDNMISFDQYKSTIRNQIQLNCQEFWQKLKNCLTDLQLDTLTYNVISDENKKMAKKFFKQGYAQYWDKKDYNGVIKIFDEALSQDRNHIDSLFYKGESLRQKGMLKEALELYEKVLSIDQQHINSLNSKGDCLRMMGQYKDAISWYDKALTIDCKYVDSLNGKGAALRQIAQYQEALEYQKKAYAINPNHVLTLYEYGTTLRKFNQFSEALIYLDKASSINLLLMKIFGLHRLVKVSVQLNCRSIMMLWFVQINQYKQIQNINFAKINQVTYQSKVEICQDKITESKQ